MFCHSQEELVRLLCNYTLALCLSVIPWLFICWHFCSLFLIGYFYKVHSKELLRLLDSIYLSQNHNRNLFGNGNGSHSQSPCISWVIITNIKMSEEHWSVKEFWWSGCRVSFSLARSNIAWLAPDQPWQKQNKLFYEQRPLSQGQF